MCHCWRRSRGSAAVHTEWPRQAGATIATECHIVLREAVRIIKTHFRLGVKQFFSCCLSHLVLVYDFANRDSRRFGGHVFGSRSDDSHSLELVVLPSVIRPADTRPVRRFHPSWLYCRVHNSTEHPLFVYGPRHESEQTTLPTSLFILPAGSSTPKRWDCKGFLVPSDRTAIQGSSAIRGPVALKYCDMRRITVTEGGNHYRCPPSNGIMPPGQIDFAIPLIPYQDLFCLPRRMVSTHSSD